MTAPIVITIVSKTQPKAGGKTFKVTDGGGTEWYMWLDQWTEVQEGDSIRIESYKTKPFNGNDYHYVDKYALLSEGAGSATSAPARSTPSRRIPVPRVSLAPQKTPYVPPPPTNKDKQIYVDGIVNNLCSNPNFVPTQDKTLIKKQLIEWTQAAMESYDGTLGLPTITTGNLSEELNDEIPPF